MGNESPIPDGNWYILLAGLPRFKVTITLAPGVALRPLEAPLSVFDLAAAGAVGCDSFHLLRDLLLIAVERAKPITAEDVENAIFF